MAYFLFEDSDVGEIATFTSPKIRKFVLENIMMDKNDITSLIMNFLDKEILVYLDNEFLNKYKVDLTTKYLIIDESNDILTNLYFELEPIPPSILENYLKMINICP